MAGRETTQPILHQTNQLAPDEVVHAPPKQDLELAPWSGSPALLPLFVTPFSFLSLFLSFSPAEILAAASGKRGPGGESGVTVSEQVVP